MVRAVSMGAAVATNAAPEDAMTNAQLNAAFEPLRAHIAVKSF
jgi:hypothetical protein